MISQEVFEYFEEHKSFSEVLERKKHQKKNAKYFVWDNKF